MQLYFSQRGVGWVGQITNYDCEAAPKGITNYKCPTLWQNYVVILRAEKLCNSQFAIRNS